MPPIVGSGSRVWMTAFRAGLAPALPSFVTTQGRFVVFALHVAKTDPVGAESEGA